MVGRRAATERPDSDAAASWRSPVAKNDKSEKATPHKRQEARKEGQVARSTEVPVLAGMLLGAITLRVFAPAAVHTFSDATARQFSHLHPVALEGGLGTHFGGAAALVLLPFLLTAVVAALGAGFAMTKGNVSFKAAKPKLKNLDPKKGMEKFKPAKAGWELFRTLIKLAALAVAVWNPLLDVRTVVTGGLGMDDGIHAIAGLTWIVMLRGIGVALLIAGADYAYQHWQHEKQLRMSKQDIKDEYKNVDGNPLMKGERRRRQQQMSRNRMLADVGQADVVLVNPTEYAIALRYVQGEAAPTVLAKGMDHLARRIRDEAVRNGVPVHTDVALTRALYRQVKVGGHVPEDLYEAIAVVLVWAYRRAGGRRRPDTATAPTRRAPAAAGRA